jgi:hypothetical protein
VGAFFGRFLKFKSRACCRSSVVEHSIGNGEVDSSILSGSTRFPFENQRLLDRALPVPPRSGRERKSNLPQSLGENAGTLFTRCSMKEVRDVRTS